MPTPSQALKDVKDQKNNPIVIWHKLHDRCKQFAESEPDFLRGIDPKILQKRKNEAMEYKDSIPASDTSQMDINTHINLNSLERLIKRALQLQPPNKKISLLLASDIFALHGLYEKRLEDFKNFVSDIKKEIENLKTSSKSSFILAMHHYFLGELYSECPHTAAIAYPDKAGKLGFRHNNTHATINRFCYDYMIAEQMLKKPCDNKNEDIYRQVMLNDCQKHLTPKHIEIETETKSETRYASFFKPLSIIGLGAGLMTGGIWTALTYGAIGLFCDDYLAIGVNALRDNCCKK